MFMDINYTIETLDLISSIPSDAHVLEDLTVAIRELINTIVGRVNDDVLPFAMTRLVRLISEEVAEVPYPARTEKVDFLGAYSMDDIPDVLEGKEVTQDMVNHPSHYLKGEMETIDEMVTIFGIEKVIVFCQLNAYKYKVRAPYKGKQDEDLRKADWYLLAAEALESGEYSRPLSAIIDRKREAK